MEKSIRTKLVVLMAIMLAVSFPKSSFGVQKDQMKGSSMEHKGSMMEHKGSEMSPEQEAMMAKWQEYSTPAEGHTILNPLVGNWSYTMKHWMKAGAPAEESTGTSESSWVMGGRFVEEVVNGTSMGQPFTGRSIMGYNNGTGLYSSYWFDSMSTGAMFNEGTYDSQAKTITSSGTFFCPFHGEAAYRSVLTITDENSHSYQWYMTEVDGTEFLGMQIDYKRK